MHLALRALASHRRAAALAGLVPQPVTWPEVMWPLATHPEHPRCLTTALSQMTDIRSSTPLVPSGMAVKLSFPMAF